MHKNKSAVNVVVFDMDKTLLSCDSMELWHYYLDEQGFISPQDKQTRKHLYEKYLDGSLDIHENFRFEFSLLNRIPHSLKLTLQNYFFDNYLQSKVSQKVLQLISNYRKENALIILSTSSMRFIAEPVATFIKADHLLATDGYIFKNEYTGQVHFPPNYREGKKTNFFNWLSNSNIIPDQIVFYTDSINDLDLLESVNIPIAVNPDDALRKHAETRGWEIVDLHS